MMYVIYKFWLTVSQFAVDLLSPFHIIPLLPFPFFYSNKDFSQVFIPPKWTNLVDFWDMWMWVFLLNGMTVMLPMQWLIVDADRDQSQWSCFPGELSWEASSWQWSRWHCPACAWCGLFEIYGYWIGSSGVAACYGVITSLSWVLLFLCSVTHSDYIYL